MEKANPLSEDVNYKNKEIDDRIIYNERNNAIAYRYSKNTISIVCPSPKGKEIALKLQKHLNAELYIKESYKGLNENDDKFNKSYKNSEVVNVALHGENSYENFKINTHKYEENFKLNDITKEVMKISKGVIFISSTGIAVRAIAPFLEGKNKDPGVVVVDLLSKYAINILSGHLGGGNELTLKVAQILNVQPIITTATDNLGIIAPDVIAKDNGLIIEDLKKAKYISSLLVDGKIVGIKDDYNMIKISKGYEKTDKIREDCIWITHNLNNDLGDSVTQVDLNYSKILKLIKKDLVLGIGCRRGTTHEKLYNFINISLIKYNLDIRAVAAIVSVDVKANEDGIIKLAEKINCPFITFEREEIKSVQDKYEKSEFVLKTLGITGVCEPCVDLAGAEVIVSKVKNEGMTLAIGVLRNTNNTH
ncbi:cobalt-precorrin 5A hydrolase [Clostridium beijerinckii]|nr:cobalt-precorrin 5A hydrolase [Clostridium beijerinckii]